MQALSVHAGPRALAALREHGLRPEHVRIVPAADGTTRVDVRSKSRVGRSDLGINAHRIRIFTNALRKHLAPAE